MIPLCRGTSHGPLNRHELDRLIGDRDYRLFLNPRNEPYRARNMKGKPPSREEALELMARNSNLIRRPMVFRGSRVVLGYDPEKLKDLAW